jgi:hypothetical protein
MTRETKRWAALLSYAVVLWIICIIVWLSGEHDGALWVGLGGFIIGIVWAFFLLYSYNPFLDGCPDQDAEENEEEPEKNIGAE